MSNGSARPSDSDSGQGLHGADKKQWFRSASDGELGWLVERDGMKYIRLNRPNEELLRPWSDGHSWVPEMEHRPINASQLAKVCFDADKALCTALGEHDAARKDWLSLTDKERIAWMTKGPKASGVNGMKRSAVWQALHHVLEPFTR